MFKGEDPKVRVLEDKLKYLSFVKNNNYTLINLSLFDKLVCVILENFKNKKDISKYLNNIINSNKVFDLSVFCYNDLNLECINDISSFEKERMRLFQ